MKFIYGIICHRVTTALQVLIDELSKSPNSIILIHVDKKSDINQFKKELNNKSIIYISDRVDVRWGSFTQIEATLNLLHEAKKYDFKYFSLLSGDDICVKPISQIEEFLSKSNQEYIGHDKFTDPTPRLKNIYSFNFLFKKSSSKSFTEKVLLKLISVSFKIGLFKNNFYQDLPKLYKGTNWFTLTYDSISYIDNYLDKNKNYINAFKKSFCGDEVFFHTIIYNSPFKEKINLNYDLSPPMMALRYIDWKTGPDYPRTLDKSDFKRISSSNALFARKMSPDLTLKELNEFLDQNRDNLKTI